MAKKWIYALSATALIIGVTCLVLFWPGGEETSKSQEPEPVLQAEFLSIDPAWADSVVNTMSLEDKFRALMLVNVTAESELESLPLSTSYAGYHFSSLNYPILAYLDTSADSSQLTRLTSMDVLAPLSEWELEAQQQAYYANRDEDLQTYFDHILTVKSQYGVNLITLGYGPKGSDTAQLGAERMALDHHMSRVDQIWLDSLLGDSTLVCLRLGGLPEDSVAQDSLMARYQPMVDQGLTGFHINAPRDVPRMLKKLEFTGLLISRADSLSFSELWRAGTDGFIVEDPIATGRWMASALKEGTIHENELDRRVKRLLMARKWTLTQSAGEHTTRTQKYMELAQSFWSRHLIEGGIVLARNEDNVVPLRTLPDRIGVLRVGEQVPFLSKGLQHYLDIVPRGIKTAQSYKNVNWESLSKDPLVVALNDVALDTVADSTFIDKLLTLDKQTNIILINKGPSSNLDVLSDIETAIQLNVGSDREWYLAGQLVCGGHSARGQLAESTRSLPIAEGAFSNKTRLGYGLPIDVQLDADSLYKINWIAQEGINNGAFPGCRVLAVKNGTVVFDRAYGFHTYKRRQKVTKEHMYDLASVTKIAATTIMAMKLYDLDKYELGDSLYKYLPDTIYQHLFRRRSTLQNITWQEMLIHKSGLPAGLPYIKYVDYMDTAIGRFDRYFCDWGDDSIFNVQVAEDFYMDATYQDSIWITMNQLWLHEDKDYRYSDVNFVLMYKLFRGMLDEDPSLVKMQRHEEEFEYNAFERYLQEQVYRPLGMERTCYQPLRYFDKDQIPPTQDDTHWRRQLVHGHVHDPTAALLGGISGNAGLFSTAHDMAKLFQMLINRGYYGGRRYIEAETVDLFIRQQPGSHRGLGFNKPVGGGMYGIAEQVSLSTFGHTGWTGNYIWADPEHEVIYIFLSNRSHPQSDNPKIHRLGTSKRCQRAIYEGMFDPSWLVIPEKPAIMPDTLPPA